jgi:transcriptional regulator with XRE-family HTH domain
VIYCVRTARPATKVRSVNESGLPQTLRSGSPALFKRTIALYLRKWRLEAGLGQKDAAKRLDRTIQHISNIESDRLPNLGDLELLLDLYGKADRIPFMRELLSAAKKAKNWWNALSGAVPKWFDLFLGLESGASELATYETILVPGLLQTHDYARAVLRGNPDLTDEEIENAVEVRVGRQQILNRETDPVHLWVVLDESVLYRPYGGTTVMLEQLKRLLEVSERPGIDIQVLPYDAGPSAAQQGGSFMAMKFPAAMESDPGLVHVELLTGGQYVERAEEIAVYERAMTRLQALAANQRTSRGIIRKAMKEMTR